MKKKWTDEEVQFLKFAYPNKDFTKEEIAKAFPNLTYTQIVNKANRLGLKRYKEELPKGFKRCTRCNMILPLDEFVVDKRKKSGKAALCILCNNERNKKYRESKKENKNEIEFKAARIIETKKCSTCNVEKPLSEFYRNKKNKDGLQSKCKDCAYKYSKRRTLTGGY